MSLASIPRSARRRVPVKLAALAVAAQALCAANAAHAAETSWTGAAGQPFWDLVSNWSAGLPAAADAVARLGAADTILRSGSFEVDHLSGSGALQVTGGSLRLTGTTQASTLEHLRLAGGRLLGGGSITVNRFDWSGGGIGAESEDGSVGPSVTVTGRTRIGGSVDGSFQSQLTLLGDTMIDGSVYVGRLTFGSNNRITHDTGDGPGSVGAIRFVNDGHYVKTGRGRTTFSNPPGGYFTNNGIIEIREGSFDQYADADAGAEWVNAGTLHLHKGTEGFLTIYRTNLAQADGRILVDGKLHVDIARAALTGNAQWRIGRDGELHFTGHNDDMFAEVSRLAGSSMRNDGLLTFTNGRVSFGGALTGQGRIVLSEGASAGFASVEAKSLDLGQARYTEDGFPLINSFSGGKMVVDDLIWRSANLYFNELVVNGKAILSGSTPDPTLPEEGRHFKGWNGTFKLNGEADWQGRGDIYGDKGRLDIAAGALFRDTNADRGDGSEWNPDPSITLSAIENRGTYEKAGAGVTRLVAPVANHGQFQVRAGQLSVHGQLDNRGRVAVSNGARFDAKGGVVQWNAAQRRLGGGEWVAHDGTLGLDLGRAEGIRHNSAHIELRGASARLLNTYNGEERNALAQLEINDGKLRLADQAALATQTALVNRGQVEVQGKAELKVGGDYVQDQAAASTFIDGAATAGQLRLEQGRFGAGTDGKVGQARVIGDLVFGQAVFDVDVLGTGLYDQVAVTGSARLDGLVNLDFMAGVTTGTFRLLTAAGGVSGRFDGFDSVFDPALYSLSFTYGSDWVDLTVAAVPEPETYALLGLGLAGVAGWTRRQRRRDSAGQ